MALPFTTEQFLEVFRQYNTSIWPMQIVLTALALVAFFLAARGQGGRVVALCLAGLWTWTGIAYHWVFFAAINPAARLFAAIWVAGAAAFAVNALGRRPLSFREVRRGRFATGAVLVAYALVVYPVVGHLGGRTYPFSPTFGAPCPVTIVTVGLLWMARAPVPRHLLVAPLLWAAIGSSAAFGLGVTEDLGLLVAGLSGLVLLLSRKQGSGEISALRVN